MKYKDFQKKMVSPVFTFAEARVVGWETSPSTLRLQLHQWEKSGDLVRLKRGVYGFPDRLQDKTEIARALYQPSYISLEYALHFYGLIPDVVFAVTLVTPKLTRRFKTPMGLFVYRRIRQDLFWGFDPTTLMAEREKALIDYCYLNGAQLFPKNEFWETLRWQNLGSVDFKKALTYARRSKVGKVVGLIESLKEYGRIHGKA